MTNAHQARMAGRQLVSGFTAALLVASAVLTGVFARMASAANDGTTATDSAQSPPATNTSSVTAPAQPPATVAPGNQLPAVTRSPVTLAPPATLPAPSRHKARVSSGAS